MGQLPTEEIPHNSDCERFRQQLRRQGQAPRPMPSGTFVDEMATLVSRPLVVPRRRASRAPLAALGLILLALLGAAILRTNNHAAYLATLKDKLSKGPFWAEAARSVQALQQDSSIRTSSESTNSYKMRPYSPELGQYSSVSQTNNKRTAAETIRIYNQSIQRKSGSTPAENQSTESPQNMQEHKYQATNTTGPAPEKATQLTAQSPNTTDRVVLDETESTPARTAIKESPWSPNTQMGAGEREKTQPARTVPHEKVETRRRTPIGGSYRRADARVPLPPSPKDL